MGVSALLVLVLSGIRRMYHPYSAFYGPRKMEEATTKASEDEIKFDEVHAYFICTPIPKQIEEI